MKEITTGEAAKIAGVKRHTVLAWIKRGKLKDMVRLQKAGLFRMDHKIDKAKFEAWLEEVSSI